MFFKEVSPSLDLFDQNTVKTEIMLKNVLFLKYIFHIITSVHNHSSVSHEDVMWMHLCFFQDSFIIRKLKTAAFFFFYFFSHFFSA